MLREFKFLKGWKNTIFNTIFFCHLLTISIFTPYASFPFFIIILFEQTYLLLDWKWSVLQFDPVIEKQYFLYNFFFKSEI